MGPHVSLHNDVAMQGICKAWVAQTPPQFREPPSNSEAPSNSGPPSNSEPPSISEPLEQFKTLRLFRTPSNSEPPSNTEPPSSSGFQPQCKSTSRVACALLQIQCPDSFFGRDNGRTRAPPRVMTNSGAASTSRASVPWTAKSAMMTPLRGS